MFTRMISITQKSFFAPNGFKKYRLASLFKGRPGRHRNPHLAAADAGRSGRRNIERGRCRRARSRRRVSSLDRAGKISAGREAETEVVEHPERDRRERLLGAAQQQTGTSNVDLSSLT